MRRFYTNGEIELIAEGYRLGTPVADLARILDRTVNSIVSAANQRGMVHMGRSRRRRDVMAGCEATPPDVGEHRIANMSAALLSLDSAENQAQKLIQACSSMRRVLTAPEDPNPRHRANILSWRLGEVRDPVESIVHSVKRIAEAIQPEDHGNAGT